MAIPKPFDGDITCFLCGSPAKTLPDFGAYTHLQCRDCGEYKITLQAKTELKNYPDIKYILSGMVFESYCTGMPLMIESSHILNTEGIHMDEKLYILAKYIYNKTANRQTIRIFTNNEEYNNICDKLRQLQIITFKSKNLDGYTVPKISDIEMTISAKMKFESDINSLEQFKEFFMNTNQRNGITINYNGPVINSPVQTGDSNTAIITATTDVTADIIRQKLKESGIPEQQITAIESQIAELVAVLDKKTVDNDKLQDIFLKIKEVGGTFLVNAFAFLSKPEAIAVIHNIVDNAKNLIGG